MISYSHIHCCLPGEPCTIYVLWAWLLALRATESQAKRGQQHLVQSNSGFWVEQRGRMSDIFCSLEVTLINLFTKYKAWVGG